MDSVVGSMRNGNKYLWNNSQLSFERLPSHAIQEMKVERAEP
jgi:hypothetical protein